MESAIDQAVLRASRSKHPAQFGIRTVVEWEIVHSGH